MQYILDGKMMKDIKTAHDYIAETLDFPAYYGKNFDALFDCLTEMNNSSVIIENVDDIIDNLGQEGITLIGVFEDAADEGYIDLDM